MVRNFPRTTRRRVVAALAVSSMLMGVVASPLASADDLKDKKAKVERKMTGAHDDLEESSARLRAAASALAAAQGQLASAQAHLAKTRGELAAAEALDRQMQAKLDAAVARLAKARKDLRGGRQQVADQEHELGRIVVANYQTGDPALMGLSMVFTTQDPAQLTADERAKGAENKDGDFIQHLFVASTHDYLLRSHVDGRWLVSNVEAL